MVGFRHHSQNPREDSLSRCNHAYKFHTQLVNTKEKVDLTAEVSSFFKHEYVLAPGWLL